MVEYRPVPDEQDDVFYQYERYAFRPARGPVVEEPDPGFLALGDRRGLYPDEEDDPLCVCVHHWFDATVRGDVHPTPGVAAIASPPEHRHRGHVRDLLRESLAEYRERGARFSVLWPFRYAYYRQFGWAVANKRTTYACDPAALAFAADALADYEFRPVHPDDYGDLVPVYEAHADGFELTLDRTEAWWRRRVFGGYDGMRFVYVASRDGEDRGYLVYTIDEGEDGRTMEVTEMAFVDREAYRALLGFCHGHASQVSTLRIGGAEESTLLDLVADPEDVTCEIHPGPMVRIVDVAETLSALSYPAVDERVVIGVADPLVDRNEGRFVLDVADGRAACEPSDAEPDVTVDVAALSQLAVGYRSAPALAGDGRIEGARDGIAALDRAFPERPVFLRDRF